MAISEETGLILPFEGGEPDIALWLARHFVHIGCRVFPPSHDRSACDKASQQWGFSACVLEAQDEWYCVTAAHCWDYVEELRTNGYEFRSWHIDEGALIDGASRWKLPFVPPKRSDLLMSIEGSDLAASRLGLLYREALGQSGIQPLREPSWRVDHDEFEYYSLLGVPTEGITEGRVRGEWEKLLLLQQLDPIDESDLPECFRDDVPSRFYGRLRAPLYAGEPLTSIVGMSGGPVFGFRRCSDARIRYWLAAIQSSWEPHTKTIAASPAREIGLLLEAASGGHER